MPLLRPTPLLVALALLGGTCSKPDSGEAKPPASAVPEVSLKEVDTSALTARERREWSAQVSELLAPCPEQPVSIAQCVSENRACKTCLPAAKFLLRQVQAGKAKKDREDAFHTRFDANKVKTIITDGSPEVGAPDAIVSIVEWADFECPFCRALYPTLERMVQRFPGQVKLVYKFYPLASHPHGEVAARAAASALAQNKFWEMHHLLFDNQDRLEQQDLEQYAKKAGLDLAKYRSDFGSKEIGERIEKDKKQAEGLGLDGTPFLFINGRNVKLEHVAGDEDLVEWIKLDIELAGKTPKMVDVAAPPSGSAFAPPAPSGSAVAPPASASASAPPKKK